MALQPRVVGKCYRKIKGKICGGNIIEHRTPRERFDKIIGPGQNNVAGFFIGRKKTLPKMIFGPGEFAGYICTKCGTRYAAPSLDHELNKLLSKKLKRINQLNEVGRKRVGSNQKLITQVATKLAKILARPRD